MDTPLQPPALPSPDVNGHDSDDGELTAENGTKRGRTDYHRFRHDSSILTLAASSKHIYAGTQGGEILVYTIQTYERINVIAGHNGSVLALCLSEDEQLLFSSAGDRFVNVWNAKTLQHVASIYSLYDVGDIFCLAYSAKLNTVYIGCQNTSIQWCALNSSPRTHPLNHDSHPSYRQDRFFDSSGPGGIRTPRPKPSEYRAQYATRGRSQEIDKDDIHQFSHYGYVYSMLLVDGPSAGVTNEEVLVSGGGDGAIKLWTLDISGGGRINELGKLEDTQDGGDPVLALVRDGTFLYSGRMEGEINVWDMETRQLLRTLRPHDQDILALSVRHGFLYAAAVDGTIAEFNDRHVLVSNWKAHKGMALASVSTTSNGRTTYVTGGNDNTIALWDAPDSSTVTTTTSIDQEHLVDSLRHFVAFRTVSADSDSKADCRRAASWLRSLLKNFGAATELLKTDGGYNPIVFARFRGKGEPTASRKKLLFYGHYDVVRAGQRQDSTWTKDPYVMEGIDGYLYGRGTTDNKGPIMAAIYAVADLVAQKALELDVLFLIEGEEECGSRGFAEAIQRNKAFIGDVDWILLANSYWLDDEVPCLTYGLRGVVHATVDIESDEPDLHSGVDGSSLLDEPLKDLVGLLGRLTQKGGRVNIPGFYDWILPITDHEKSLYDEIAHLLLKRDPSLGTTEALTNSLIKRWADASLSLHGFKTSGPQNATIIPRSAQATLSMRLVPNQEVRDISESLIRYLQDEFAAIESKNHLKITIGKQAEPWLGDYNNELFQTLEGAIMDVWGSTQEAKRPSTPIVHGFPSTPITDRRSSTFSKPATSSTLAISSTSPATDEAMATMSLEAALLGQQQTDFTLLNSPKHANNRFKSGAPPNLTVSRPQQQRRNKPLYIREGGSIAAIRFLEKEFHAPAAHLPCGQASDNAHLDNERFRVLNLYNSKEIFELVFRRLPGV